MSTQHTLGPWNVLKASYWIIEGDGKFIATADHIRDSMGGKETCAANARLIAAAPELLEALEELRDFYRYNFGLPATKANAAIAKAKGESR